MSKNNITDSSRSCVVQNDFCSCDQCGHAREVHDPSCSRVLQDCTVRTHILMQPGFFAHGNQDPACRVHNTFRLASGSGRVYDQKRIAKANADKLQLLRLRFGQEALQSLGPRYVSYIIWSTPESGDCNGALKLGNTMHALDDLRNLGPEIDDLRLCRLRSPP